MTNTDRDAQINAIVRRINGEFFYAQNTKLVSTQNADPETVDALEASYAFNLNTFSDSFLTTMYEEVINGSELGQSLLLLLGSEDFQEVQLHEYHAFRPLMREKTSANDVLLITKSLRLYPQLPQLDNYAACDPDTLKKVAALVIITGRIHAFFQDLYYSARYSSWNPMEESIDGKRITSDALVELVLDQPEDAHQITDIVLDRKTTDVELIRAILGTETKSLSSGVL